MKEILTYIMDDLKCITLTKKGWNYVGITMLVLSGILWGILSEYGDLGKIIGCISYVTSSFLFITKSGWGEWLMENMFDDEGMVPFEE